MSENTLEEVESFETVDGKVALPAWKVVEDEANLLIAQFVEYQLLSEEMKAVCLEAGFNSNAVLGVVVIPVNYLSPDENGDIVATPFLETCFPGHDWKILITGDKEIHGYCIIQKYEVQ